MNKKPLIAFIAILVLALAVFSFWPRHSANVTVTVSPKAAKIKLDGKKGVSTSFYASPGKHSVTASFNGFADSTQTFTAQQGKTAKVSLFLPVNSDAGKQYLTNHPDEASTRQSIVGTAFQNSSQTRQQKYPIISQLPYIERYFRVDYEQSPTHPKDDTAVALTVAYYAPQGKQQALDWIQSLGYNPANFEIIYNDQSIETTGGNE